MGMIRYITASNIILFFLIFVNSYNIHNLKENIIYSIDSHNWSIHNFDIKCYTYDNIPIYFDYIRFEVKIKNDYFDILKKKNILTYYQTSTNTLFHRDFNVIINSICIEYINNYNNNKIYIFYYNFIDSFRNKLKNIIQKYYIFCNIYNIMISYNSHKQYIYQNITNNKNIILNSKYNTYIYKIKFTHFLTKIYYNY